MVEIILGVLWFFVALFAGGLLLFAMRDSADDTIYVTPVPIRHDIAKLEKEVFEKADLVTKIATETRIIQAPILGAIPVPSEGNPNDTATMRSITVKVEQIKKCAGIE